MTRPSLIPSMHTTQWWTSPAHVRPNPPEIVASLRKAALDYMRLRERVIVTCFSVGAGEHEVMGYVRQVGVGSVSLSLLREHGGGTHGVPLEWVRTIRKAPPRKRVTL